MRAVHSYGESEWVRIVEDYQCLVMLVHAGGNCNLYRLRVYQDDICLNTDTAVVFLTCSDISVILRVQSLLYVYRYTVTADTAAIEVSTIACIRLSRSPVQVYAPSPH